MSSLLVSSLLLLEVLASLTMGIGLVNNDFDAPSEKAVAAVIPVMVTPQSPPIFLPEIIKHLYTF